MSDFIEEVKEDVRLDHLFQFFKTYANHLIAGVLILILGLGGYAFWQSHQQTQQMRQADLFAQALKAAQENHPQEAQELLQSLEKEKNEGYKALAAFRRAQLESTSSEDRKLLYLDLSQDKGIDIKLRELALVLWGYESIDSENVDILFRKLQPLAEGHSAWVSSAQELLALTEIRQGNFKAAAQRLENLVNNEEVVLGVRQRASALREQLDLNQ